MGETLRFAVGMPDSAYSTVWRVNSHRDDVYVTPGRSIGALLKFSLHGSGVWVVALTSESAAVFPETGNRRGKKWKLPNEVAPGFRPGPAIVVPRTSRGTRPVVGELGKTVQWVPAPAPHEAVEFLMLFASPGNRWGTESGESMVGRVDLATAGACFVVASRVPLPPETERTVESLLSNTSVRVTAPEALTSGAFLWITESPDTGHPIVFDLPVPVEKA